MGFLLQFYEEKTYKIVYFQKHSFTFFKKAVIAHAVTASKIIYYSSQIKLK